jgi:glucose-1-phosphate thymidylyltransferase
MKGWIDEEQIRHLAEPLLKSGYGEYLLQLLTRGRET